MLQNTHSFLLVQMPVVSCLEGVKGVLRCSGVPSESTVVQPERSIPAIARLTFDLTNDCVIQENQSTSDPLFQYCQHKLSLKIDKLRTTLFFCVTDRFLGIKDTTKGLFFPRIL